MMHPDSDVSPHVLVYQRIAVEEVNTPSLNTFIGGEFHLGLWSFIKKGVGLVGSFFVLRTLDLYQLGLYQLLLSGFTIASDICHDLFASITANEITRAIGEGNHARAKRLFWEHALFRMMFVLIPAVAVWMLLPQVLPSYGSEFFLWARILSLIFVLQGVLGMLNQLLSASLQFKVLAMRPSLQKFGEVCFVGYFFFKDQLTITQLLLGQLVGMTIAVLTILGPALRTTRAWANFTAAPRGQLYRLIKQYGGWQIIETSIRIMLGNIRPWIIRAFLNTASVGIYSVASMATSLLKDVIPTRTLNALIPRVVGDRDRMNRIFVFGTKYYVVLSIVLICGGAVGYPIAVHILFPHLTDSITLFYLLLPTVFLFAFTKLTNIFLVAERRQRFIAAQSLVEQTVRAGAMLGLVPIMGLSGLAIAETFAYGFVVISKYYYLVRTGFIQRFPFSSLFRFNETDRTYARAAVRSLPLLGKYLMK